MQILYGNVQQVRKQFENRKTKFDRPVAEMFIACSEQLSDEQENDLKKALIQHYGNYAGYWTRQDKNYYPFPLFTIAQCDFKSQYCQAHRDDLNILGINVVNFMRVPAGHRVDGDYFHYMDEATRIVTPLFLNGDIRNAPPREYNKKFDLILASMDYTPPNDQPFQLTSS